jgi:CHRD domain
VRKRLALIALAVAVASVVVFGGPASAGKPGTGTLREAELSGAQVIPTPGDPDGGGQGRFHLYPQKNKICYRVTVNNIQTATRAHIHKGTSTEAGPIVKGLKAPSDGSSSGCVRLDRRKIMKIKNNPSGYYVNVHNDDFPNGAVRGQLSPSP